MRVFDQFRPENILLKQKGKDIIALSDFGLSRVVGEGSFMKTLCGTPQVILLFFFFVPASLPRLTCSFLSD